jgi:hypothetical protein
MNLPTAIDINSLPLTNPDSIAPVYCNNANIALAPWDVRIVFSEIIVAGNAEDMSQALRANVAMNPAHAKALAGALSTALSEYEKLYGQIKMPEMEPRQSAAAAEKS